MRKLLLHPGSAYLTVFLLSVLVRTLTAIPIRQPGYMDAYYYYHVASNLYQGKGFTEDFIWNYLAIPDTVTHASNLYWMPFVSIILYVLFFFLGEGFRTAQVPLILLSSLYPVVAFWLGNDIFRNRRYAWTMALLTIFSGTAFVFWIVPDNFAPYALAGCLSMIFCYKGFRDNHWYFAAAGGTAAVGYLSRPDGVLLLGTVVLLILVRFGQGIFGARWSRWKDIRRASHLPIPEEHQAVPGGGEGLELKPRLVTMKFAIWAVVLAITSFGLVIAPWLLRNQMAFGNVLPSAGTKTMFLTEYNDIFAYGKDLNLEQYLRWGWGNILQSKGESALQNLLVIGGLLLFYMAPFALIGFFKLGRRTEYWPFFLYASMLVGAMSLLFTFPGPRGSLLHSAAALLPFLYGAAILGLDATIVAVAKKLKHWRVPSAQRNFTIVFVVFALVASTGFAVRAAGDWDHHYELYRELNAWLSTRLQADELVMTVDPPGYYYASGRKSIVVTNNNPAETAAVCRRYGVKYILVEAAHHPKTWHEIYLGKEVVPELSFVEEVAGVKVFAVQP